MKRIAAAVLALALTVGPAVLAPTAAQAKARVTVVNDRGTALADTAYRTKLTITGRGFQTIAGGFGGIYLMFGWVDDAAGGSWKPSRGGLTGTDYRYVPDSESSNNQGYLKFIAFPGSSTEAEAQAVLTASGRFSVGLTVPGPTFRSVDRDGTSHDVDCREVRCGVITIGAHGVKNPRNETFTPVRFANVFDRAPEADEQTSDAPTPTAPVTSSAAPTASVAAPSSAPPTGAPTGAPAAVTTPKVTTDRATARAGHVLAFSGVGFRAGENVTGVLDDGVAGIGPLVAGSGGDVAGVLRLPRDLEAGTHELRLTGALSGAKAGDRFPVQAAVTTTGRTLPVAESSSGPGAARLFLLAAAGVFALAAGWSGRRVLRRRSAT